MMHILDYFVVAKCGRYLAIMHSQLWWLFTMATSCNYYHYFASSWWVWCFLAMEGMTCCCAIIELTCVLDSSRVVIYITNSKGCLDDVLLPNWTPTQQLYNIICWVHGCESLSIHIQKIKNLIHGQLIF
jgi:hypothetical protein